MEFIKKLYSSDNKFTLIRNVALTVIVPLFLILISCSVIKDSKKPTLDESSKVEIGYHELYNFLSEKGILPANRVAADDVYSLASINWIRDTISYEYNKFLSLIGMARYETDSNDCDDFARAFTLFCKKEFRNSLKDKKHSIAVGEFYYIQKNGKAHAINFMIVLNEKREKELLFYEPQMKQFIKLSDEEIQSCLFFGL